MLRALIFSFALHAILVAALIWSTQVSLLLFKSRQKDLAKVGVVEVDLLYKPTETRMRKGDAKQDLPPPPVRTKTAVEPDSGPVVKKTPPKKKEAPKPPKKEEPKKNFQALFDQMRQDAGEEARRAPRDDNFPTREDGEEKARGTGGSATYAASLGTLALQTAARKYFELPRQEDFARRHPNAKGFLSVRLAASGNSLELVALKTVESSGFDLLDSSCKNSIIKAIQEESFAPDVISELAGKETTVLCSP